MHPLNALKVLRNPEGWYIFPGGAKILVYDDSNVDAKVSMLSHPRTGWRKSKPRNMSWKRRIKAALLVLTGKVEFSQRGK